VFAVDGGVLGMNSLGKGGGQYYESESVVDSRLPWIISVRGRVMEQEGDMANNKFAFAYGSCIIDQCLISGHSIAAMMDWLPGTVRAFDSTQFHTYELRGEFDRGYKLNIDGTFFASDKSYFYDYPNSLSFVRPNVLMFGDYSSGPNTRAEFAAYSFTQPRVVGQNPPPGTLVPNKTAVDLTIVDGPATETVPNVIGLSQPAAQAAIVTANLKLGGVTSAPHPTIPAGQVSDQSPLPNIHVPKDTPVAIVMSTGPPGPIHLAPAITSTPVLTATAGQPYAYQVTATDPNVGDVLTYSLTTARAG
jgi:hypothetical protein